MQRPFWQEKRLEELTHEEWESLCDGCGLCCLIKLEDEDTGDIANTDVACRQLDIGACRCSDYANRHKEVAGCLQLDAEAVRQLGWLPETCAYRLLAEGRPLYWWHPLVSGDAESVHAAGMSARDRAVSEREVAFEDLEDHVTDSHWRRGK